MLKESKLVGIPAVVYSHQHTIYLLKISVQCFLHITADHRSNITLPSRSLAKELDNCVYEHFLAAIDPIIIILTRIATLTNYIF